MGSYCHTCCASKKDMERWFLNYEVKVEGEEKSQRIS